MKKFYFLFSFILLGTILSAQTFVIEEDSMSLSIDVEQEYNASFTYPIIYNDSVVADYKWTLTWDAPDEWQTQLCLNPVKCYPYDEETAELSFESGINYEFALKVIHNDVCGEGDYTLRLESLFGVVLEEVKSHVVATNCAITPTSETEIVEFKPVPNPAGRSFSFNLDSKVKSVDMYSSLGSLVKSFSQQNEYDVSELSCGLYYLRIVDASDNVQTTSLVIE